MIKVPSKYQALFFDFDGVLADTVEVKTEAFGLLFDDYGPEIREMVISHHRDHGGMPRVDKFRHYYQYFLCLPLSDDKLTELCDAFEKLVVDKVVSAPEIPGAEEFLILNKELPRFVISGTPHDEIREIIQRRGWSKYFEDVCGAPISKTEHLGELLSRFAFRPDECLFFGDATADYDAAKEHGVPFIGILPDENAPLLRFAPDIKWAKDFKSLKVY